MVFWLALSVLSYLQLLELEGELRTLFTVALVLEAGGSDIASPIDGDGRVGCCVEAALCPRGRFRSDSGL